MADPLTLAVASAVAGKAAESVTDQARQAISTIIGKLRVKLGKRSADLAVVDEGSPEAIAGLLDREFAADPGFRDEIRELWLQAAPAATGDAVSNVFGGQADRVIQLRDVHGDINFLARRNRAAADGGGVVRSVWGRGWSVRTRAGGTG